MMPFKSTMMTRIYLGGAMTLALLSLLVGEGWLAIHQYFFLPPELEGIVFCLVAALMAAWGCLELLGMARSKGLTPLTNITVVGVALIVGQPFWTHVGLGSQGHDSAKYLGIVVIGLMFMAAWGQARKLGPQETLANLSVTCFCFCYFGLGLMFLVLIRLQGAGTSTIIEQVGPVIMFLACVKSADIGAYFTGRAIGRHLWVPSISPAKTWEGFGGGVVLTIIVASLLSRIFGIMDMPMALLFGLFVAVTGQLGDLLESMLKRDAGNKDSAQLLPAFGGVLDLMDSVLVAAPFAWAIFEWTGR